MSQQQSAPVLYEEECISGPLLILSVALALVFVLLALLSNHPERLVILIIIDALLILNTYSMRISVDQETVVLSYGLGVLQRVFDRHSVERFQVVKNDKVLGWLYNPRGDTVLIVQLRGGLEFVLPAASPKALAASIDLTQRVRL